MNRLIIIGAGGHGKIVADIALKNGYTEIYFVDDNKTGDCMGISIVGKSSDIEHLNDGKTDFAIGIGNNQVRMSVSKKYDVNWVSLIHPSAQIGVGTNVGKGSVVMAGAIINACSQIGEHCIVNTGAIVEHDSVIGDGVHISPAATLCGTVTVGRQAWIGACACVVNNVEIGDEITVGAGAVVTKTIKEKGTYVGVPARKIK